MIPGIIRGLIAYWAILSCIPSVALAAPLVQQFVGFETGGLFDEIAGTAGTPCIGYDGHATCDTGCDPWSSDETWVLGLGYKDSCALPIVTEDGGFIHSFVVQTDNVTTIAGGSVVFADVVDSVSLCWHMRLANGTPYGTGFLRDANGATLCTWLVGVDFYVRYTLYWEKNDTANWALYGSAPGDVGETLLLGSGSSADLDAGGTTDTSFGFYGVVSLGLDPSNIYIDNAYVITDATGIVDALGWYTVVGPYQTDHASATGDNGTDSLIDGKLWENMAATPADAAFGTYDYGDEGYRRTNGTARSGPNGDSRLDGGHVRAAKWIAWGKRYDKYMWYGKATTAPAYTVVKDSQLFTNARVRVTYDVDDPVGGTYVPKAQDWFVLGFSNESDIANDSTCKELWGFVLQTAPLVSVLDYERMHRGNVRGNLRGGW